MSEMKLQGQLTLDDFRKAQALHGRQNAAGSRIFLVAVVALFYFSLLLLVLMGKLQWPYLVAPLAVLLVFLLFQYVYRPYLLKRVFTRNKDLSAPFELELSGQGLSISNPQGNALIAWTDFKKWAEGKDLILLYRSQNTFQMVPKRLFDGGGGLQYLREQLIVNHVPDAGKGNKKGFIAQNWLYIVIIITIMVMLFLNIRQVPR